MIEWLVSFKRTKKMRREKVTAGLFCLMYSSFELITVLCCVGLYCFELNCIVAELHPRAKRARVDGAP